MTAVEERANEKDPGLFSSELMALEQSKSITLEGDYIEKKSRIST